MYFEPRIDGGRIIEHVCCQYFELFDKTNGLMLKDTV
jgi:hypothetical protein